MTTQHPPSSARGVLCMFGGWYVMDEGEGIQSVQPNWKERHQLLASCRPSGSSRVHVWYHLPARLGSSFCSEPNGSMNLPKVSVFFLWPGVE